MLFFPWCSLLKDAGLPYILKHNWGYISFLLFLANRRACLWSNGEIRGRPSRPPWLVCLSNCLHGDDHSKAGGLEKALRKQYDAFATDVLRSFQVDVKLFSLTPRIISLIRKGVLNSLVMLALVIKSHIPSITALHGGNGSRLFPSPDPRLCS